MSTPPKYLQELRKRTEDALLDRLTALADDWDKEANEMREQHPPSADESSVRADVRARCLISVAAELRRLVEDARA